MTLVDRDPAAAEDDWVGVSDHVLGKEDRWLERSDTAGELGPRIAWAEGEPVDRIPEPWGDCRARYHARSGVVLIVRNDQIVTVLEVDGFSREHRSIQTVADVADVDPRLRDLEGDRQ